MQNLSKITRVNFCLRTLEYFFRIRTEEENPDQELHEIQEAVEQEQTLNTNGHSVIKRAFTTPSVRRALFLGTYQPNLGSNSLS